jgi:hypothetical protein
LISAGAASAAAVPFSASRRVHRAMRRLLSWSGCRRV